MAREAVSNDDQGEKPSGFAYDISRPSGQSLSEKRQETLLDEAIEETFPASDPISPMVIR